jgi:hypothetical protein
MPIYQSAQFDTEMKHNMVRFAPTAEMFCYQADKPKNNDDLWYTAENEEAFRQDEKDNMVSFLQLKIMAKKAGMSGSSSPISPPFGLEQQLISRQYTKKRAIKKKMVLLAVRHEQSKCLSYEHPEERQDRIALASMRHSKWARDQARAIGIFQDVKSMGPDEESRRLFGNFQALQTVVS